MRSKWTITKDLFLTQEEVHRLYKQLSDAKDLAIHRRKYFVHIRDYYIIRTLLETGLRVFELTNLRIADFKGDSLIVQNGKGNKKRNIILTKQTQKLLRAYIRRKRNFLKEPVQDDSYIFISNHKKPFTTRAIRKRVKYWFAKCGFSNSLSCHSCRHSYVSHLIAAGVDLTTIRDNAGHTSLAVTSIYSHVVSDNLEGVNLYSSDFNRKRNFKKFEPEKR